MRIPTVNLSDDWTTQLRRFRRLRALKQTALAEMLGVDQATVSRWESGRQNPDLGTQRRLRSLMQATGPHQDVLLKHWINSAVGYTSLSDENRVVIAASPSFCEYQRIDASEIVGMSLIPAFTEELESLWGIAIEHGFLEGDIASVTTISRAHLLSGRERNIGTIAVWTPVPLADGRYLRRVDVIRLSEEQFAKARADNGGPIRLVTMADLAR
jgi:transcriptional regulator with XRE-family HTH domain